MIYIFENFLSDVECDFYVNLYYENLVNVERYRDTFVLRDINNNDIPKKLGRIEKQFKIILNYWEIVKWPPNSFQDWHYDGIINPKNHFTGILYLNDNFIGGETVVNNQFIKPIKGSFVFFQGSQLLHKVKKIEEGDRFTIPCWFRNFNS